MAYFNILHILLCPMHCKNISASRAEVGPPHSQSVCLFAIKNVKLKVVLFYDLKMAQKGRNM
jgi:hypothetical protein